MDALAERISCGPAWQVMLPPTYDAELAELGVAVASVFQCVACGTVPDSGLGEDGTWTTGCTVPELGEEEAE